jgi:hypothetical protein
MGDRTFYYLPSVMEFKENGDGRIDIGRSLGDLWSGGSLLHYSLSETSLQETSVRIEEVEISGGVYAR